MVGIVLVSHSNTVATGAAELAREVGGEEVRIETAGGLDAPDHPMGTDAVLVLHAIERAWSEDGVLVLMDLGSAVLSSEMALDLMPADRRAKTRLTSAPFVEGVVSAAVAARLGSSLDEVAAEAETGLAGKRAHLGNEAGTPPSDVPAAAGPIESIRLMVDTAHGLHARPAARLVQTASGFPADVRISNRSASRGPVTARSLNAVATLGVAHGDEIEVTAAGPQATEAVAAIRALAARNFDEAAEPVTASTVSTAEPSSARVDDGVVRGAPASPGAAVGVARRFHEPPIELRDRDAGPPEEELRALHSALAAAAHDLSAQRSAVAARAGEYAAAIFDAHLLFLGDELLLEPIRSSIREQGRQAAVAWRDGIDRMAATWDHLDDPYLRERAADLRSVGTQVLAHLVGVPVPGPVLEGSGILVVADLAPADAVALDPTSVLGIATAFGGPTSHAAVLARSFGIPAVMGCGEGLLAVAEGTSLGLDGDDGVVFVDPGPELVRKLEAGRAARADADRVARAKARSPATTLDGILVEVSANVGGPEEVPAAVDAGADGVGLFRTEFLFTARDVMPSEEEQEAEYRRAAEALHGRPLTLRTLDVGADKPLAYLPLPAEPNPFLGVRGLRLGLERPELLRVQLRAILRVAADHPLRVMFPMVSDLEELRAARALLDDVRSELAPGGEPRVAGLEVGAMVEVPAAALLAGTLAAEADFLSIGTNDLTQYALAADRGNDRVAALNDPLHPAVLELVRSTVAGAQAHGRWVGVCGELAGDDLATSVLLGLGVRELSMSPPSIPAVKAAVRRTDVSRARRLAEEALGLPSASAVRTLLRAARDGVSER